MHQRQRQCVSGNLRTKFDIKIENKPYGFMVGVVAFLRVCMASSTNAMTSKLSKFLYYVVQAFYCGCMDLEE